MVGGLRCLLTEPSERPVPGVRGERSLGRGWEVAAGLFLLPGKKARSRCPEVGVLGGKVCGGKARVFLVGGDIGTVDISWLCCRR
jgi:hypothetical protein